MVLSKSRAILVLPGMLHVVSRGKKWDDLACNSPNPAGGANDMPHKRRRPAGTKRRWANPQITSLRS
jgi:hypothetical protein